MIVEKADKAISTVTTFIQMGAQLLIGVVMVIFVGLPLVAGGVASGFVPLALGLCAFAAAGRSLWRMRP